MMNNVVTLRPNEADDGRELLVELFLSTKPKNVFPLPDLVQSAVGCAMWMMLADMPQAAVRFYLNIAGDAITGLETCLSCWSMTLADRPPADALAEKAFEELWAMRDTTYESLESWRHLLTVHHELWLARHANG